MFLLLLIAAWATPRGLAQTELDDGWVSAIVGTPVFPGSSTVAVDGIVVEGSGNFWNTADRGHYLSQAINGDFDVVVRAGDLTLVQGPSRNTSAKAGLMLRTGTTANAPYVFVFRSPHNGTSATVQLQQRELTGVTSVALASTSVSATGPLWLRLTRSGATVSASYSVNGTTWTAIGSSLTPPGIPRQALLGLAVSSNDNTSLLSARFTDFAYLYVNRPLTGTGLTGEYFKTDDLAATPDVVRGNEQIAFPLAPEPASTDYPAGTRVIRWTGRLRPYRTQTVSLNLTGQGAVRLWLNGTLLADQWSAGAKTITTASVALTGGVAVPLQIDYRPDAEPRLQLAWSGPTQPPEVISRDYLWPEYPARGRVLREVWGSLGTATLAGLAALPSFPQQPFSRQFLPSLEVPLLSADPSLQNSGTLIRGYLHPPLSGQYTFRLAGDTQAEAYLSTDDTAANRQSLLTLAGATAPRDWTASGQGSATRTLQAGRRYYVEVRQAASSAPGHVALGWIQTGRTQTEVIGGAALSPFDPVPVAPTTASAVLGTAATGHPRLLANAATFGWVRAQAGTPGTPIALWYPTLLATAKTLRDTGKVVGRVGNGDFLYNAREVLKRIQTLALVWQVERDPTLPPASDPAKGYLDRAMLELANIAGQTVTNPDGTQTAGWVDWNSSVSWLNTAELAHAAAIGYDWLYEGLSPGQRTLINDSLRQRALVPGISALGLSGGSPQWWVDDESNWNVVCLGGLIAASVAYDHGDNTTSPAATLLPAAIAKIANGIAVYQSGGGHPESPPYWAYATSYLSLALSALETAGGGSFGLGDEPGLDATTLYPIAFTGSSVRVINYGDGGSSISSSQSTGSFYFSLRYNRPSGAAYRRARIDPDAGKGLRSAYDLIWADSRGASPAAEGLPTDTWVKGVDLISMRSSWTDNTALNLLSHGGHNTLDGHSLLERGSFVLDANTVRFVTMLGGDDYGLPNYFKPDPALNPNRWSYYRTRAAGSNTLVITAAGTTPAATGPDQSLDGFARVSSFRSTKTDSGFELDLSSAYPLAESVRRSFRFLKTINASPSVIITDRIRSATPVDVRWRVHTEATVTLLQGSTVARLTRLDYANRTVTMLARILSPASATFVVEPAAPPSLPAGQDPNTGLTRLNITLPAVTERSLVVEFIPLPSTAYAGDGGTIAPSLLAWRLAHFGSLDAVGRGALDADPDRDGLTNLMEYALGTDPLDSGSGQRPDFGVTGEGRFSLRFPRLRSDLTYTVETSTDLQSWSVLAVNPGTTGGTAEASQYLTAGTPRTFLRLKVAPTSP